MDEHGSSDKGSLPDRRARDSSIWAFLNIMLWGWGGVGEWGGLCVALMSTSTY